MMPDLTVHAGRPRAAAPEIYPDIDKLAAVCRGVLRQTPEYREARERGEATAWLQQEAMSMAYFCQEAILQRLGDLDAG